MSPGNAITRAEIQAELIGTLFRSVPIAIILHTLFGTLLVSLLWNKASHSLLLVWLAVIYCLTLARWVLMHAYQRCQPALETMPRWGAAATALSWIFALAWGIVPVLFLDPAQPANLVIITVILVGLNAQALMAVVSYPPAHFASVLVLLSLTTVLLLRGGILGAEIALLVSLNLAASLFYARNVYKTLNHSLRLRFENTALRRETEEKSALLESTLQHIQQGISLVDRECQLRMWNRHFLDLLGLGQYQIAAGQNFNTVLSAADPPLTQIQQKQTEYRRADGAIIEIRQNTMPDGGWVLTYTDISELKHREEALDLARQEAERANAAKTRFLATASHDLRQPIHALGLFFANLVERVRNPETAPLIKQIEDSIEAIDTMLNALLDISKLDAGVVHPHVGPVMVAGLFKRLATEYQSHGVNPFGVLVERRLFKRSETEHRSAIRETSNVLRMRPSPVIVQSDPAMLERILRNLISNALRYTQNGRVLVGARRLGDKLRIEVHDTGPGIPNDQLENIFLEFHQLGNPERDRHQGLGLGLAIVKRLAALLGHQITVRSHLGRGSCFSITLPIAQESTSCLASSPAVIAGRELQDRQILILDDDSAVLEAMEGLLQRWGCTVIKAASLEEAQEKLKTSSLPPELLIVDYRLRGDLSGLEAVEILQKNLRRYVPTLVITGDTSPDHLREAEASGYPLLHKPVQPAKLRGVLRHLIRRHERESLN
ncbi:MAG TPA: ATP-binding protein [Candidatus Competibacteraceae bacterium]|nr:PAS-domain containing protein [Candidatus Competibacteraceae bacterium]MCP5134155.1 PAS-domain containing protein [Gammaproteobacteria bacterium]HPF59084.1 ATP-binding protein [Candidatus Competibacteraceae bacterium]HRX70673.1 ATP-binding protein [Candidatus Competibacteraceae bacterium]